MFRLSKITLLVTMVALLVGLVVPTSSANAAPAISGTITSPPNGGTVTFCGFTVTGTVSGGTDAYLIIRDTDGSVPERFPQIGFFPVAGSNFTQFVQWTDDVATNPTDPPEPNMPLIIDLISSNGTTLSEVVVTLVADCTATSLGISGCNLSDGSYQDALTANTQLFWGPDLKDPVQPNTVIPAGQVVTVLDNNSQGWLHILWACNTYYIQVGGQVVNPAAISKPYLQGK